MPPFRKNWLFYLLFMGEILIIVLLLITKAPKSYVDARDYLILDVATKKMDTVIYGQRDIILYLQNDTGRMRQINAGK
jgi:hypothetical protein